MRMALIAALGLCVVALSALAQQPAPPPITQGAGSIKRTPLQKFDVPGANSETIIGIAEIGPNVNIGRHTHPGPESGYVIEGDFELIVEGQPSRQLKVGDSYLVPPGAIHDAKSGAAGAKVIATYVIEKGKPLATPAQ